MFVVLQGSSESILRREQDGVGGQFDVVEFVFFLDVVVMSVVVFVVAVDSIE